MLLCCMATRIPSNNSGAGKVRFQALTRPMENRYAAQMTNAPEPNATANGIARCRAKMSTSCRSGRRAARYRSAVNIATAGRYPIAVNLESTARAVARPNRRL